MGFFEQWPTWNNIYCWESFIICLGQWKCMLCFWARFHLVACTSNLLLKPHSDLPQHVSGTVAHSRVMCHDTWRSCFCTSFLGWTPVSAWIRLWPGAATAFSCCLPPLCLECLPSQDGNCCSFPELIILRALLMVLLWHCSVVTWHKSRQLSAWFEVKAPAYSRRRGLTLYLQAVYCTKTSCP